MMLAALGMFVFEMDSAPFEELSRRRGWRHGRTDRFGAMPASQFLGPGDDQVTLSGRLAPELAGDYSAIDRLVAMAGTGEAFPLGDGAGRIHGQFVIESIDETHRHLIEDGRPRLVDFTITLTRVQ